MSLVAGVDSSTQSCKVVIRDSETGALVREGRAGHPDGTEVAPAAWWDALQNAIADAGGLADVSAVSIGGQQHGMVVLDADGRVIRDALLWNDTRSASAAAALIADAGQAAQTDSATAAEAGAAVYAERTGSVPVASFTATKLRWLRDAEPANAARVAAVALPHDWLTWRLLGYGPADESPLGPVLDALTTDRSDASGTCYWSPAADAYDFELFELAFGRPAVEAPTTVGGAPDAAGVAPVILPRIVQTGDIAGVTVDHPGDAAYSDGTAEGAPLSLIPAGILVGAGAGDNAGAALGLNAAEGDVVISIGTSGTAFAVTDHPVADATGTVAGFADAAGAFLPLVATLNAARILASISAVLGADYDEFARLALDAEPGSGGVVLVPYFEGERTPNLPDATATLAGLTLANSSRENFARAAIEGMLCALADGLAALRSLGVDARRVLLVGGAAQNTAVQAVAAEVFDVPVSIPAPGEYVADGAARQAAWTLTGTRPTWPVAFAAELAAATVPLITQQYRRAQSLGSLPR